MEQPETPTPVETPVETLPQGSQGAQGIQGTQGMQFIFCARGAPQRQGAQLLRLPQCRLQPTVTINKTASTISLFMAHISIKTSIREKRRTQFDSKLYNTRDDVQIKRAFFIFNICLIVIRAIRFCGLAIVKVYQTTGSPEIPYRG